MMASFPIMHMQTQVRLVTEDILFPGSPFSDSLYVIWNAECVKSGVEQGMRAQMGPSPGHNLLHTQCMRMRGQVRTANAYPPSDGLTNSLCDTISLFHTGRVPASSETGLEEEQASLVSRQCRAGDRDSH